LQGNRFVKVLTKKELAHFAKDILEESKMKVLRIKMKLHFNSLKTITSLLLIVLAMNVLVPG